jgi:C1A family cysteine protease
MHEEQTVALRSFTSLSVWTKWASTGDASSPDGRAGLRAVVAAAIILSAFASAGFAQLTAADIAALQERGKAEGWTFTVGETSATSRSLDQLCGFVRPADWRSRARFDPCVAKTALPAAFDWRARGGCTSIKDQWYCGSCWAFASAGALECAIKIIDGVEKDLSEQWLVSCNRENYSCDGGFWVFDYFKKKGDACKGIGAVLEHDLPYYSWEGGYYPCDCPYTHHYTIDDWAYIGDGSDDIPSVNAIKQAIMDHGPVAVSITADQAFSAYTGGVFNACSSDYTNHAVLLVGWDDRKGSGAWILRNSWGDTWWGEGGYMWIKYGCSRVGEGAAYVVYNDCNSNGVGDDDDIALGTSTDCNQNKLPDECEPLLDCNGNGVVDICEIAAGTLADCDENSLADACEIAAGTGEDCDHNGVLDKCQIPVPVKQPANEIGFLPSDRLGGSPTGVESLAENFVLSETQAIASIRLLGVHIPDYDEDPVDSFTVIIHKGRNNLPSDVVYQESGVSFSRILTGVVYQFALGYSRQCEYTLALADAVTLNAGAYYVEVYDDSGDGGSCFYWQCGDYDYVNGIPGMAVADQTPGISWGFFDSLDLSLQLNVDFPGDCNVDGLFDACHLPFAVDLGGDRQLAPGRTHASIGTGMTVIGGVFPLHYLWQIVSGPSFQGLAKPNDMSPAFTPTVPGDYVLRCTVTDSNARPCMSYDELVVHVASLTLNIQQEVGACVGFSTLPLGGNPTASGGTPPYSYLWTVLRGPSGIDEVSQQSPDPMVTPPVPADYDIRLDVQDSSDPPIVATGNVHVAVSTAPTVAAGISETRHPIIMIGEPLILGGSPTVHGGHPPFTYLWSIPVNPGGAGSFDNVAAANPAFSATAKGAYVIRVEVADAAGCPASTQFTVSVVDAAPYSTVPVGAVGSVAPGGGLCGAPAVAPLATMLIGVLLMSLRHRRR